MISTNTSNIESDWQCQKCPENISVDKISKVTQAIKEAAEKLEQSQKVEDYEKFAQQQRKFELDMRQW